MNLDLIYRLYTCNLNKKAPLDVLIKVIVLNTFGFLSFIVSIFFVVTSFNNSATSLANVLLGLSFLLLFNYIALFITENIKLSSLITVLSISFVFIYLLVDSGKNGFGYLWFYGLPIISIFLLGIRIGSAISIGFLLVISGLFYLLDGYVILNEYTAELKIRILLSYFIIFALAFVYEFVVIKVRDISKKNEEELKVNNLFKDEFITQLSHQLRTISNNIYGLSSIINVREQNKEHLDLHNALQVSSLNLVSVIDNIVEISDFDKDKVTNSIDFTIKKSIDNTCKLFESNETTFNVNLTDDVPLMINGNPFVVKQLIFNIVNTLVNYKTKPNILIEINVSKIEIVENKITLKFIIQSNRAIFIKEEGSSYAKINQLNNNDAEKYIDKLNLKYSQKIINSFGGDLIIKATNNSALMTFDIFFNVSKPNINLNEILFNKDGAKKLASAISLSSKTILVVDDNMINQKLLRVILKDIVGRVDVANNGKEALLKYAKTKYDLVFMDIEMPILDGVKATKKIRELEFATEKPIPIIAITANTLAKDKQETIDAGMNDYITKPYQKEKIIEILNVYLG